MFQKLIFMKDIFVRKKIKENGTGTQREKNVQMNPRVFTIELIISAKKCPRLLKPIT